MTLLTDPKALSPSLARERNRRDATPREADARLMASLLRKEPAAADALNARYASRIHGLGLVLLKNKADAEDLVQDTFLKVWRTGQAPSPQRGSLDAWVLLTARSLAIDLLRRRTLEARKLRSEPSVSDVSDEQARKGMRSSATLSSAFATPWTGVRRGSAPPWRSRTSRNSHPHRWPSCRASLLAR
jgi:hypothetical protein